MLLCLGCNVRCGGKSRTESARARTRRVRVRMRDFFLCPSRKATFQITENRQVLHPSTTLSFPFIGQITERAQMFSMDGVMRAWRVVETNTMPVSKSKLLLTCAPGAMLSRDETRSMSRLFHKRQLLCLWKWTTMNCVVCGCQLACCLALQLSADPS